MGSVIHLRKQSSQTADLPQFPERIDDLLADLGAIANGIAAVEDQSAMLVRGIVALQTSLEKLECIYGAIADSEDHEQFLRETKMINARLQSELTRLATILQRTRTSADQVRQFDHSAQ